VRSWFGLINQVAYSFLKTEHMAPFRHLLSQSQPFMWDQTLETAFRKSKEKITVLIVKSVAYFDVDLVTCLCPAYSKQGMGWILQQKTCSCPEIVPTCCADGWRLVLAGGHFCNQAEFTIVHTPGKLQLAADALSRRKTKLPATIC
jgi:hypothetical protein